MIDEHLTKAHLHGYFPGFPHQEGDPSMEDQDDSTRIILKLLWTHQEYFDQKALSKAQAEYNYYRTIERAWKKTVKYTHSYKYLFIHIFWYFPQRISGVMVRCACLECGRLWVRAPIGSKDYKIGICCFSAKHAALRR